MKYILLLLIIFTSSACHCQALELSISTPQPRLGESFYISFNTDTLSKGIFILPKDKFTINSYIGSSGSETTLSVNLVALKVGNNSIGPLTFKVNGIIYKTTKLEFTVADSLPTVDRGLWIRKVPINDTTQYIIIDQRQHAHNVVVRKDDNTINTSAEADNNENDVELVSELENARIEDWGSSSTTMPDFINNKNGYRVTYKCYKITILNKKKPLILGNTDFKNLPDYYKFKEIILN